MRSQFQLACLEALYMIRLFFTSIEYLRTVRISNLTMLILDIHKLLTIFTEVHFYLPKRGHLLSIGGNFHLLKLLKISNVN